MQVLNRIMINICSDKFAESKYFYTKLFDFTVDFESDWFIHLISKDKNFELGIIDKSNDLIPKEFQHNPQGFYVTFVVESVDKLMEIVEVEKFEIVNPPMDTFYGQRRLLLKDPNGALVDISSLIKRS